MTEYAVEIDHLSKRFHRHVDRRSTIRERIVRGRPSKLEEFWAVRDVSLKIPKGSLYGLIGHNGSGKSTLLKMIGGIYRPTEGSIKVDGRLAALIEVGAGFHPDMTGRENIKLNGAILGLGKQEVEGATESIIEFSGLRQFIDDPVKHYSSGMYVRLGFSVAVHMRPEVLIVDEVLAVGDEEFQRKCLDHLSNLRKSGCTIILVSHGLGQVESLCDDVTWLEHGVVQEAGEPSKVVAAYLKSVNAKEAAVNPLVRATRAGDEGRAGDGRIRVTSAELLASDGSAANHAETGQTTRIRLQLQAKEQVLGPNVRIALQSDAGPLVAMVSNHRSKIDFGYVYGANEVDVVIIDTPLLPGRYRVHIDIFDHTGSHLIDTWNDAIEFAVRSQGGEIGQGLVQLKTDFRLFR